MSEPGPSAPDQSGEPSSGTLDISEGFANIFTTPIVLHRWPESDALNEELGQPILAKEAASGGEKRSNVGGWHSDPDFFSWDAPCIREMRDRVISLLKAMSQATMDDSDIERNFDHRLDGWANVNRDGCYNNVHNHPNCVWSGTYYVSVGELSSDDRYNGKLELLDPRAGAIQISIEGVTVGKRCLVNPEPGMMVMFPAWLNHFVHPFFGKGERISIAFNILMRENPPPDMGRY